MSRKTKIEKIMKARFTLLAMLFLLTTSIYALEHVENKRSKIADSFSKRRAEMSGEIAVQKSFQQKMGFNKQVNSLKSAQAIKQKLDSYTEINWDDATNQWVTEYKSEFTYDANGNMTQENDYEWDKTSGQLALNWKTDYSYDANGNNTQEIGYEWDERSQLWVASEKTIYSYDANGNSTQRIFYQWDSSTNTFVSDEKDDYTYDANGNLIQYIYSSFDKTTNQWVAEYKKEYNYDANGNQTQISYDWDNTLSQWASPYVVKRPGFSFDANGRVIRIDEYHTIVTLENPIYEISWKYEYTYSANGDLSQELDTDWDNGSKTWIPRSKSEYIYNTSVSFSELIVIPAGWFWEYGDEINYFNHQMTSELRYVWDINTNKWLPEAKTQFIYSPINVTSVNPLNAEISSVYPNPCSESVSFSIPGSNSQINFELFDLQGRQLLSKAFGTNEKVNMEGFRSGMYLYKLNIDGKIQSGKLVKK